MTSYSPYSKRGPRFGPEDRGPRHASASTTLAWLLLAFGTLAASDALAQENATSELLLYVGSTRIGAEQTRVEHTADGWTITGSGRIAPPIDLVTRRLQVRYDPQWNPLTFEVDGTSKGSELNVRTTFAGTTARSEIKQLGQVGEKTDAISPGALVLPNLSFAAYEALAKRLSALDEDQATLPAYIAPQGEIQLEVKRLDTQTLETPHRTVSARRFAVTFMNPGKPLAGELWIDQHGRLLRFELTTQSLVVIRDDISAPTTRRQTITRADDESVRIPGNGFNLVGTVSRPSGQAGPRGRYPAVVMVPGSGPTDRDEAIAGVPIFGQLAGMLADTGFLVLRYDKRGVGQSGGRAETATLADYAEDVRAAVRFLARRKDVDRRQVAVFGHSEGAWTALLAASREKRIAALILAAAASGNGAGLVLEQQKYLLDHTDLPEPEKQSRIDLQKRIHAAVLGQGEWTDIPEEMRRQADTPWFQSLLAFDAAAVMPRVRQPILIVHGERDRQVPPAHAERLAELARSRKNAPAVDLVKVEGINHLLVPAATGETSEYAALSGRSASPEVARAVSEFLRRLLGGT